MLALCLSLFAGHIRGYLRDTAIYSRSTPTLTGEVHVTFNVAISSEYYEQVEGEELRKNIAAAIDGRHKVSILFGRIIFGGFMSCAAR